MDLFIREHSETVSQRTFERRAQLHARQGGNRSILPMARILLALAVAVAAAQSCGEEAGGELVARSVDAPVCDAVQGNA